MCIFWQKAKREIDIRPCPYLALLWNVQRTLPNNNNNNRNIQRATCCHIATATSTSMATLQLLGCRRTGSIPRCWHLFTIWAGPQNWPRGKQKNKTKNTRKKLKNWKTEKPKTHLAFIWRRLARVQLQLRSVNAKSKWKTQLYGEKAKITKNEIKIWRRRRHRDRRHGLRFQGCYADCIAQAGAAIKTHIWQPSTI